MVVQHHNGFAGFQEFRTFRDTRFIHIHHHQHRITSRQFERCRAVDYHIRLIFRVIPEELYKRLYGCRHIIDHNMRLFLQRKRDPCNTDSRAETVNIRYPVPHNDDAVLTCDDLTQRLRFHSRLHPRIFFHLLALAAIVSDIIRCLDHSLVAAPPQRQIDGISRKLIILGISQPIKPHADTQRHSHLIADIDRLYILQYIEPVILELSHRFLAQDHQIFILLKLLRYSVQRRNIFIDFSVDQRDQQRAPDFFHTLQRLVIIVKIDQTHGQRLVVHFAECNLQCRLIEHV